ncbi:YHYH protein [Thalassotalea fonticola]|uniref:YHYH protein n=1 Tax=Thalassotalea fonticola TaxID=3065649 RepID=A0ABZ0GKB0_9GAMM|nr:YHYH protein [Colwelliaceae bacterium S1-1]
MSHEHTMIKNEISFVIKLLVVFMVTFSIVSCGGSNSSNAEETTPAPIPDTTPEPEPEPEPEPSNYTDNPDLNETTAGMLNAVLTNRNPDCRAYASDQNDGDYSSSGMTDKSNAADSAPYFPGTNTKSKVYIDLVIVSGDYIQDPDNPYIAGGWNYENVTPTQDPELATHCRMIHNMIPNHDFGWGVGAPNQINVWVTEIDHDDMQITYLPVKPKFSEPLVADDTDRNPTNFMDYDGILLNGIGIAMDSGFCYNPAHPRVNPAGNATGCGPGSVWFEIPAYTLQEPEAENMAAIFDDYYGHGFEGTYHYHAMTHPLQDDEEHQHSPSPQGSPLIGYAKDGFPIYGQWFVDQAGDLVKAQSGYALKNWGLNPDINGFGQSRVPYTDTAPFKEHGTPPTPWDVINRPDEFDFSFTNEPFGVPLGRYIDDWEFDQGNTGNLDECNGATDINGVYGYYITDTYPYGPICTFGVHEPSFGKVPPLRWNDELNEQIVDENGELINGH